MPFENKEHAAARQGGKSSEERETAKAAPRLMATEPATAERVGDSKSSSDEEAGSAIPTIEMHNGPGSRHAELDTTRKVAVGEDRTDDAETARTEHSTMGMRLAIYLVLQLMGTRRRFERKRAELRCRFGEPVQ